MTARWLLALLLAICCGCAAPSVDPPGTAAPSPLSRSLTRHFWGRGDGVFRGRFSAVLEGQGPLFSCQGVLLVDPRQGQARLVALSDLGMRLFDVTVTLDGTTVQAALPHLGLARLRQRLATAVRRMLLSHLPGPRDAVADQAQPLLRRCLDGQCLTCAFDAGSGVLLYKAYGGQRPGWRAEFSDYQDCGGYQVPARLRYADHEQGFTLTMAWNPEQG